MDDLRSLVQAAEQGDVNQLKSVLDKHPDLVSQKDESGATALHYAAFNGQQSAAELLIEYGAEVNSRDSRFGATPAGWAIEYLRERGAVLGIEISDLAFAISIGDSRWVSRFLKRLPALRTVKDGNGTPLEQLARESGNREIAAMFAA